MPIIRADGTPFVSPPAVTPFRPAQPVPSTVMRVAVRYSGATVFEVGETASGILLQPLYSATPNAVSLSDSAGNPVVQIPPSSFDRIEVPYSYRLLDIGEVTLTLTVASETARGVAALVLRFDKRFMWGFLPTGQTATSLGASLQNKILTTTRQRSFTAQAGSGNKLWVFYPTSFGAASFKIDALLGGMYSPQTLPYTNPFGITENFLAYESVSSNLGVLRPSPVDVL